MENESEYHDSTKTPRRTRRSSSADTEPISQHKRSTRKAVLAEIKESENLMSDHTTSPRRSVKVLDFQTPSRSEGPTSAQTPRRSVRKSIKPLQDYENIVAQKGLSASHRAASSSVDESEERTEGKWEPAVIGRVSTKRGKKSKRTKNKQLQRQKRITEEMAKECNNEIEVQYELNGEKEVKISTVENSEVCCEKVPEKRDAIHGNDSEDDQVEYKNTDVTRESPEENAVKQSVVKTPDDPEVNNDKTEETMKSEEKTEASEEVSCFKDQKDENDGYMSEASSMEEGDIEMAIMPVTADDCMESPEKLLHHPARDASYKSLKTSPLPIDRAVDRSNESDCIMLSFIENSPAAEQLEKSDSNFLDSAENNMSPLLVCSDDEEEFIDAPNSLEETKDTKIKTNENSSEPKNETSAILDGTFDADKSIENTEAAVAKTPLLRPSITRIATPFKSNVAIVPDIVIESEEDININDTLDVVMNPNAEKLKSNRKRSFSVTLERPKKAVTFHSPSNTIISIRSGDLLKVITKKDHTTIAQRRKRSISLTETDSEVIAYFNNKKTPENTPEKQRKLPNPSSRTKMPNFAAIHQQQFQKMESITDHVARRAERAKILTSSAKKFKPSSIQKGFNVKNCILRDSNKDSTGNKSIHLPMPKARQRIELFGIEHTFKPELGVSLLPGLKVRSKSKQDLTKLNEFQPISKVPAKINASSIALPANTTKPKLPKPRFDLIANAHKAPINQAMAKKTAIPKARAADITIAFGSHLEPNLPDSRHKFNLSTAIETRSTERLDDRRKRIMEMYKSRGAPRTGERRNEILKGVRTNRRFELQMQCRNRPN